MKLARSQDEFIRAWLRMRDVPCPTCGYNLHGASQARCPECGARLRLALCAEPQGAHLRAVLNAALGGLAVFQGVSAVAFCGVPAAERPVELLLRAALLGLTLVLWLALLQPRHLKGRSRRRRGLQMGLFRCGRSRAG